MSEIPDFRQPFDGSCGCSSEEHLEASEEYLVALDNKFVGDEAIREDAESPL